MYTTNLGASQTRYPTLAFKNNCKIDELTDLLASLDEDISLLKKQRAILVKKRQQSPKKTSFFVREEMKEKIEYLTKAILQKEDLLNKAEENLKKALDKAYKDSLDEAPLPNDSENLFGDSLILNGLKAAAVVAALPVTAALHFARNHPYIAAGVVLGSQFFSAFAAPLQDASQNRQKRDTFREYYRAQQAKEQRFTAAVSECQNEEIPTAGCAEKLINAWDENANNLDKRIVLERILTAQHKEGKYQDGYTKAAVNRAAKWYECAKRATETTATPEINQATTVKCKTQYEKWLTIATKDTEIYHNSLLATKQNVLDNNLLGNASNPTLEQRQPFAEMSSFPYTQNTSALIDGWELNRTLTEELATNTGYDYHEKSGQIFTLSGLSAYVFEKQNSDEDSIIREICLSFGGTTAGLSPGPIGYRVKTNSGSTVSQLIANVASTLSLTEPRLHQQAIEVAQGLETLIHEKYDKAQLTITGHSLGGGLCTSAAGMTGTAEKTTPCFGFSSAPINEATRRRIAIRAGNAEHAKRIMQSLQHIIIEGDPVPHAGNTVSGARITGTVLEIPPQEPNEGTLARHSNYREALAKMVKKRVVLVDPNTIGVDSNTTDLNTRSKRDTGTHGHQREPKYTRALELELGSAKTAAVTVKPQTTQKPIFTPFDSKPTQNGIEEWIKTEAQEQRQRHQQKTHQHDEN